MPQVGETLAISLKLHNTDNSKFVRCILKLANGTNYGSPFLVPNVGLGQYQEQTHAMPAGTDFVSASFEVFDDAGFSTKSANYTDGTDTFKLEIPNTVIFDILNDLKNLLQTSQLISANSLLGIVEKFENIVGQVKTNDIIGDIESSEIAASVSSQTIVGEVSSDED